MARFQEMSVGNPRVARELSLATHRVTMTSLRQESSLDMQGNSRAEMRTGCHRPVTRSLHVTGWVMWPVVVFRMSPQP